jgi:hypothetical protein
MAELLREHYLELAWGLAGLLVIMIAGVYLVRRFRDRAEQNREGTSQLLTKFGEMHSRGDLSETEYRTIKTVLAAPFRDELSGDGDKG